MNDPSANPVEPMERAKQKIHEAIMILSQNGVDGWREFLQQRLDKMNNWYETKEAFFQIGQACHPKALGDLQLANLSWREWLIRIGELRAACSDAFNHLESVAPRSL